MTETVKEKSTALKVEEKVEEEEVVEKPTESKNEIITTLEAGNYRCIEHPNGIILGVRLDGIKGKRGVHVDIVHVVDWRKSVFTGTSIAIQAAILETVNRDTVDLLTDVGLSDRVATISKRTTKGRIHLQTMLANEGHSGSLIHETRLVYVVTKDTRPTVDLSWLTDGGHIVGIEQFPLARQSDARAILPEINRRVNNEKWDHLQRSVSLGWVSVLFFAFTIIGLLASLMVMITGTGTILFPIGALLSGGTVGSGLLFLSRKEMNIYQELVDEETGSLSRVGDSERIKKIVENNADTFQRLRNMSFVISPLMANVGGAIQIGDMDGAVYSSNQVLDKIVEHSQEDEVVSGSDAGLAMFLGTFASLDPKYDEDTLSLCYVGLSNYLASRLTESDTVHHCSTLLNALARSGILRPDTKSNIDDMFNKRCLILGVSAIDEDLAKYPDEPQDDEEETADGDVEDNVLGDISSTGEEVPEEDSITAEEQDTASSLSELQETTAKAEDGSDIPVIAAVDAPEPESMTEQEPELAPRPVESEIEPVDAVDSEAVLEPESEPIEGETEVEPEPVPELEPRTEPESEQREGEPATEPELETTGSQIVRKKCESAGVDLIDAVTTGLVCSSRAKPKKRRRRKSAA